MSIGTVAEVVKAVKAIDYQSAQRFETITSVAFDARKIQPGGLFVPLKGATDGHDYVQQAIEKGALAVLWGKPDQTPPEGICAIWVDDPLVALQDLARWYLTKRKPIVIAITGSSGKTTTKDMVAAIVGSRYTVYKTQGNYNNEIGLPQTILDMPSTTEVLVLEMGMSEFGEIAFLSRLARPQIAVITMIGESHVENLGSVAGVAQAKMEMLAGLQAGGTIIYPYDEPLLNGAVEEKLAQLELQAVRCVRFGIDHEADLWPEEIQLCDDSSTFVPCFKETGSSNVMMQLPVIGRYNIQNALAAIAVGQALGGISLTAMQEALQQFDLTKNRTQWVRARNQARILNDAYNASPTAMKAVLAAFSNVKVENGGRRIAVLGDIRELGEQADELHASVAEAIAPNQIDKLYLYGQHMQALKKAILARGDRLPIVDVIDDKALFIKQLQMDIQPQDVVLVKSSNGTGLLEVVDALIRNEER